MWWPCFFEGTRHSFTGTAVMPNGVHTAIESVPNGAPRYGLCVNYSPCVLSMFAWSEAWNSQLRPHVLPDEFDRHADPDLIRLDVYKI